MKVTKEVTFHAAHRLYEYVGACGMLHGHTYRVQCSWSFEDLDSLGMGRDFGICKREMQKIIDKWDHKTLLNSEDPLASLIEEEVGLASVCRMEGNPTAENMALCISKMIPECTEVTVWETPTSFCTL